MTDPVLFTLAVLTLLATPGPTNTLLLTAGAADGARSFRLIPAEVAGYLVAIVTIGFVVGPYVAEIPGLGLALRLLIAGYLIWIAVRLWRRGVTNLATDRLIRLRDVFVTTLLNPKALLFALGIVPLHESDGLAYLAAFSLMVVAVGAGWITIGISIRRGLLSETARGFVPCIGALVIGAFAGYLVMAPFL